MVDRLRLAVGNVLYLLVQNKWVRTVSRTHLYRHWRGKASLPLMGGCRVSEVVGVVGVVGGWWGVGV